MRKMLDNNEVATRLYRIFGAIGYAKNAIQVAEAVLDIFDRANNPEQVVHMTLSGCNLERPSKAYKFTFPTAWPDAKWKMASKKCLKPFVRYGEVIESSGSIGDATKMVLGALKHLEGDERVVFFVSVITHLCPYNFYKCKEKGLSAREINAIGYNPVLRELFAVLAGESGKRFPTDADEGDYILTLLTCIKSRREMVAFFALLVRWAKKIGAEEQGEGENTLVVEGTEAFMDLMLGMGNPMAGFLSREGGSALGFTNPKVAALRDLLLSGVHGFRTAHDNVHGPHCDCESCEDQGRAPYRPHHPDQPEDEGFYSPEGGKTC